MAATAPLTGMPRAVKTLRTGNRVLYSQHSCRGQRLAGEYSPLLYLHRRLQATNLAPFTPEHNSNSTGGAWLSSAAEHQP